MQRNKGGIIPETVLGNWLDLVASLVAFRNEIEKQDLTSLNETGVGEVDVIIVWQW